MYCIPNTVSHSSILPSLSDPLLHFFFQKRVHLPGITSYNKIRHKISYQGLMRQLSRRKRVLKADKKAKTDSAPIVMNPRRTPRYAPITYMQRG